MAFHSYTHLIRKLFNAYRCGPPSRVTGTSSWTCVDHSVSRLPRLTRRPVQARFHCGCASRDAYPRQSWQLVGSLCKRHAVTRKKLAPTACRRMGSGTISLPSSGCFSPFPHGTRTLSVSREYLALPDGPGRFTQDYSCPALLRIPLGPVCIRIQDCHLLRWNFPEPSPLHSGATAWSYNPADASLQPRFGLFPGRSPLLGESLLFSLPGGTKMFQFPPFASLLKT